MSGLRGQAAVVGVTDAVSPTGELDLTGRALEAQMVKEALDDAGLSLSDVDGICSTGGTGMGSLGLAEFLGIHPTYTDSTSTGGSSFQVHCEHAAAAIAAGLAEVIVTVFAQTPRAGRRAMAAGGGGGRGGRGGGGGPGRGGPPMGGGSNPSAEWEMPYGLAMPMGAYALAASRHMAVYGTKPEHFAQIAVSTRQWASMNPRARYQDPITIDDVLNSPMQASPLHLLDCCLVTDGAGAFVMTSAERAKDLKKKPAYVLGAATCHDHAMISQMPDLATTAGAITGPKAFGMAGIKPGDVNVLMGYDSFTITQLLHFEDLGFCAKGEGGPFVEDGKTAPGGSLPTNTNGGGLSYTHPGMYGMFIMVEATRQLRGECGERNVQGAEIAVGHGSGGVLSCMSTIVLGTEATL